MTRQQFEALLTRRDEIQRSHERACAVLEEEPHPFNHKKCVRLYDELAAVQKQIDDELEAERAAEERAIAQADAETALELPEK